MPEAQLLKDEVVKVDQRQLINKVLARYPGDFTLFREFLQNADDAESSAFDIHFVTAGSSQHEHSPPIPPDQIVQWIFKNNLGKPFEKEGWDRLTRIAMGNPNSQKVGAFGIGFYSIFAVTEGPTVSSNGHVMEFRWEGDQLHFKLEDGHPKEEWTVFKIPLREPAPLPRVVDLMRFLATSMIFMVHMKHVRLFLDERCIGSVQKDGDSFETIDLPITLKCPTSTWKMDVPSENKLHRHQFRVQAEISAEIAESAKDDSNSQYATVPQPSVSSSRTEDHSGMYSKDLKLTVYTVDVDVDIETNTKLCKELSRCMGKEPPRRIKYSLVYTGRDEYEQSSKNQQPEHQSLESIFRGICADLGRESHSKIFIGQPTSQTTGIGGHMESHFFPTSERESIDLADDSNVATWNQELLHVGGFLCRAVYELELAGIQDEWQSDTPSDSNPQVFYRRLRDRFIHVLKFFSFHSSTPLPKIAEELKQSFYACCDSPPRLLSTVGVHLASDTRVFDDLCNRFLKDVPMLDSDVAKMDFIKSLPPEHTITAITPDDVEQDLHKHALEEGELIACLQWMPRESINKLLPAVRFRVGGTDVELSTISHFIDSEGPGIHIPSHGPLPPYLLARHITQRFRPARLREFGWREFTIVDWLQYISDSEFRSANPDYDFTKSIGWAERVLRSLSLAWTSSSELVDLAKSKLTSETCIPTTCGLRKPNDSYLPSSRITIAVDESYPIVQSSPTFVINEETDRLLKDLDVNRRLPSDYLVQMLEEEKMKTSDLVDYLVHVGADSLTDTDKLRSSDGFEGIQGNSRARFQVADLYPPMDIFRQLRLPVIDLGPHSKWQDPSPIAKILYHLGLRRSPPLKDIVNQCASKSKVRGTAFGFLCKNLQSLYSNSSFADFQDTALIPAENNNGFCIEKPGDVFLDPQWKTLGFSVVQTDYPENDLKKLGVQRHPPSSLLLRMLKERRQFSEQSAHLWFATLSIHVSSFARDQFDCLSQSPIVPKSISGKLEWLTPVQCYLQKGPKHDLYSTLFHYVEFDHGEKFLRECGAKNEPSEEDIARRLLEDPKGFYEQAKGHKRFLEELRDLAPRYKGISGKTIGEMRRAPILLGVQHRESNPDGEKDIYSLFEPSKIVIVNDEQTFRLFADSIVTAPRDMPPELQEFYRNLGSNNLTQVVRDELKEVMHIPDSHMSSQYEIFIQGRLSLFLENRSPSGCDIIVRVCERLCISQTLIGDNEKPKEREAWAWATALSEKGTLHVWLSKIAKQNIYELATSLCRELFSEVNNDDALLLSNILSEDIEVLKQRGYKVEKVLKRYKSHSNPKLSNPVLLSPVTDAQPIAKEPLGNDGDVPYSPTSPLGQIHLFAQTFVNGVGNAVGIGSPIAACNVQVPADKQPDVHSVYSWDPCRVITQDYLNSMVKKSIHVCRSGKEMQFDHHGNHEDMKKPLNNRCWEVSMEKFTSLKIGKVDVLISGDIPAAMRPAKNDLQNWLDRFGRIIDPIADIYGLPNHSVRVFYDTTAGRIAFNHKGTLHLNLRYFEAWHYKDVTNDNHQGALSSWFLTMAHEIAHNIIKDHNAEHEFWFWAVCATHLDKFSQLLASNEEGKELRMPVLRRAKTFIFGMKDGIGRTGWVFILFSAVALVFAFVLRGEKFSVLRE